MIPAYTTCELNERMADAELRYGPFASSHEAMGVCSEEWDELRAAVHANDLAAQRKECLDLAAALIRWHDQLTGKMAERSVK